MFLTGDTRSSGTDEATELKWGGTRFRLSDKAVQADSTCGISGVTGPACLGHPPACEQDGSNYKDSYEAKEGDANHEGRRLDFFNLFRVGLEVNHFTPSVYVARKQRIGSLIGIQGEKL